MYKFYYFPRLTSLQIICLTILFSDWVDLHLHHQHNHFYIMAEVTTNTSNDSIADEPPPYSVVILSSSPETCKENENESENPQAEKSVKKPIPSSLMASFFSPLSSRISPEKMETGRNCCYRSTGLLLAFASGILMTAYSAMIKFLDEMDSMQVVIIRGTMQAVILGSVAAYNKSSFIGKRERWVPLLLFLVAFTGGLRILFIFTSVSRLPLGDSTTILFSSPVFVMVFSIFLLKVLLSELRNFVLDTHNSDHLIWISTVVSFNLRINA